MAPIDERPSPVGLMIVDFDVEQAKPGFPETHSGGDMRPSQR
jgi:hypothetical protein